MLSHYQPIKVNFCKATRPLEAWGFIGRSCKSEHHSQLNSTFHVDRNSFLGFVFLLLESRASWHRCWRRACPEGKSLHGSLFWKGYHDKRKLEVSIWGGEIGGSHLGEGREEKETDSVGGLGARLRALVPAWPLRPPHGPVLRIRSLGVKVHWGREVLDQCKPYLPHTL